MPTAYSSLVRVYEKTLKFSSQIKEQYVALSQLDCLSLTASEVESDQRGEIKTLLTVSKMKHKYTYLISVNKCNKERNCKFLITLSFELI